MRSSEFTGSQTGYIDLAQTDLPRRDSGLKPGKIFVVGIGPGAPEHMTVRCRAALSESDIIAGYKTYVDLIRPFIGERPVVATGMRQEVDRCREVVNLAIQGHHVALVSSGDAGVYGMAGILIECLAEAGRLDITVEIIPGVTAANAAASVLGAPLMHDFAVISLSDLLTPWELIEQRVKLAAQADFVLAIYNPKSKGRTGQIERVREILLEFKDPSTPVGLVREALRGQESTVVVTTLDEFTTHPIDMLTTVIIGNSQTRCIGSYMVTPRGYRL